MKRHSKVPQRRVNWILLPLLGAIALLAIPKSLRIRIEPIAHAATISVTNTNDDGPGSLRNAIVVSNLNMGPGANVITFNIPGPGLKTINLASDLPTITAPVTIDGTTQPGFAGSPIIQLDGQTDLLGLPAGATRAESAEHGLDISAGGCTVRGFIFTRFSSSAIVLRTNGNNVIQGNYIGTDATGAAISPNSSGINVQSSNNTIGGTTAAARNVISGNPFGAVYIFGSNNSLIGNVVGLDATGKMALGSYPGVDLEGNDNIIGGNNVISGNNPGVFVRSSGNTIKGNMIGTDVDGRKALPNSIGITVVSGSSTIDHNLISGNRTGIAIGTSGNTIDNNIIGLDNDRRPLANSFDGISLSAGPNTIFSNRIDFSGGAGVRVRGGVGNSLFNNEIARNAVGVQVDDAATGTSISGNSIFDNAGLGIDLAPPGVNPNHLGGGGTGANNLQNFPVLTSAIFSPATHNVTINGTLNSTPNATFLIELYISSQCDPSGFGEGQRYIGYAGGQPSITTDSNGNGSFSLITPAPNPGEFITATATDPAHNTSEFSHCLQVDSPGFLGFKSLDFAVNENAGLATVTVVRTNGSMGAVAVNYATSDGTAKAGTDYTAASGTLTFADGETIKNFSIPILDNALTDGTRTIDLSLSNPTNGAALGNAHARVVILDDESPAPPILLVLALGSDGFSNVQTLKSLSSAAPGQILSSVPISGLQPNEIINAIDFRPLNGKLYGLGSSSRLYTIDTATGVATPVGAPFTPAVNQFRPGFSFNPVTDRIRVTTRTLGSFIGQNLQLNPDTGQVVSVDTTLAFAGNPPPNADQAAAVVSLANTNKFAGANSTTTYGINFRGDDGSSIALVRLGSIGGSPISPNTGQLFVENVLEPAGYLLGGFDIADNGRGFVILGPAEFTLPFLITLFPDGGSESEVVGINDQMMDLAAIPTQRVQFSASLYSINENGGAATVTVNRNGGSSGPLSVNYVTSDGTATAGLDYTTTSGTLNFAAGETAKTISIPLLDDSVMEGVESINVTLSNATNGAVVGPQSTALIAIMDEPTEPGTNPIDNADFFVRQHYADFLNRNPDAGGLTFWTNHITSCFNDANCINERRVGTSAAFFIENEFQQTGFFIYRFYQASLGRRPSFGEFNADRGKVVGGANLENGKQAFATEFVQRHDFLQQYPLSQNAATFVDALILNASQVSGIADLATRRDNLINQYNQGANQTDSRARVVRALIDDSAFSAALYNPAFVLMQYFGYLQRGPDQAGYDFWLDHLNNRNPNNYRAMVCAFITSAEYQRRFSQIVTHSNQDCGP